MTIFFEKAMLVVTMAKTVQNGALGSYSTAQKSY
jgi:hypothetical protein